MATLSDCPTNGGAGTDFINGDPAHNINPYILSVFINDAAGENETFYLDQPNGAGGPQQFGYANLSNAYYSSTFATTGGISYGSNLTVLGTAAAPLRAPGLYTFTFLVQVLKYIFVNLTYINSGPVPLSVTEVVTINITNPTSAGVVGDPQFAGLRGQSYQIHGVDGVVYNIITEQQCQVNARFVFLSSGECPLIEGVAGNHCWSHPGSYLGALSVQQVVEGTTHRLELVAGSSRSGFGSILLENKTMAVGATFTAGAFSVVVRSPHQVHVQTEHFSFEFTNSDMFINQAVASRVLLHKLAAHGLLGQTHSLTTYPMPTPYTAGEIDDYAVADGDLFGSDFTFNLFQRSQDSTRPAIN